MALLWGQAEQIAGGFCVLILGISTVFVIFSTRLLVGEIRSQLNDLDKDIREIMKRLDDLLSIMSQE